MYLLQAPSSTRMSIELPSSKSISNRALIMNALSGSQTDIERLADCNDTKVLLAALSNSDFSKNIGAAGTAMRFLTAYYAMTDGRWVLDGSPRMRNRPIAVLVEALRTMGAEISYLEKVNYPPLEILGKRLRGGTLSLDGSVSSQYLSALMMIAPCTEQGLLIHIENKINSRPYLEMTAAMMRNVGIEVDFSEKEIRILPQAYRAHKRYVVEADWSAASYWFELMSLISERSTDSRIELKGLSPQSLQGDSMVKTWFEDLGVNALFEGDSLVLTSKSVTCPFLEKDFSQQPDLAQTFVVTCALKNIPFMFYGLESLRIKETDRIQALMNEMRKLGYVLEEHDNTLSWKAERCAPLSDIRIETYDDHRMAMAFAPAAVLFSPQEGAGKHSYVSSKVGSFGIVNPEVVAKSYQSYWDDLCACGFTLIQQ